jgi:flagellar motor switch protein FliN/FliY
MDQNQKFSPEDFGLDSGNMDEMGGDAAAAPVAPAGGGSPVPRMDDDSNRFVDISRMKMVLDVPLKVTVELGRTKLLINDLLQLGQGSVIELDKMAGEPMEIYVNDKLVALGEVVVVNEKFGIRLTDIMSGVGIEEMGPREVA